ncbi:MAG TPA: DUF4386 domain-containing protein [Thermoleophilia bacterium]|nr:DUF4386 domain-containing protein [Thermoleophilia bacterium]
MLSDRRAAVWAGVLFIAGDVAGFLSVAVLSGLLKEPADLAKIAAHPNQLAAGALLIVAMGVVLALVPIVLYPVFRRYDPVLAMGYVVFRGALETVTYLASAAALLVLLALSKEFVASGAQQAPHFATLGSMLLKAQGSTIADLGSVVFAIGAFMYNWLLHESRLVPRWLAVWGLAGAVLYLLSGLLDVFAVSAGLLLVVLAVQEIALALWLIVKGFNEQAGDATRENAA